MIFEDFTFLVIISKKRFKTKKTNKQKAVNLQNLHIVTLLDHPQPYQTHMLFLERAKTFIFRNPSGLF